MTSSTFSSVCIVDFEQVNVSWEYVFLKALRWHFTSLFQVNSNEIHA